MGRGGTHNLALSNQRLICCYLRHAYNEKKFLICLRCRALQKFFGAIPGILYVLDVVFTSFAVPTAVSAATVSDAAIYAHLNFIVVSYSCYSHTAVANG